MSVSPAGVDERLSMLDLAEEDLTQLEPFTMVNRRLR